MGLREEGLQTRHLGICQPERIRHVCRAVSGSFSGANVSNAPVAFTASAMKPSPASINMHPALDGLHGRPPRHASLRNASFRAAITVGSGRSVWECKMMMVKEHSFEKLQHPSQSPLSLFHMVEDPDQICPIQTVSKVGSADLAAFRGCGSCSCKRPLHAQKFFAAVPRVSSSRS